MPRVYATLLGKAVRAAARLRGGGSALPGLVAERLDPRFLPSILGTLPHGVVVISGTNGKTTTTKMVVELLRSQGLRVFTNPTGSNFTRGVAAALLGEVDWRGRLAADIAVLELDEAHAVLFVKKVAPKYSLLLNVMRDQLDRFGEIDSTARLLRTVAAATTDAVVLNREDRRIAALHQDLAGQRVTYFGLSERLREQFPSDDSLHGGVGVVNDSPADVTLLDFRGASATFQVGTETLSTDLKLTGVYNVFNAAAAIALVRTVVGSRVDLPALTRALAEVRPAFGRGEKLLVDGQQLELVLVKNPSGFRLGLQSFDPAGTATMIAINDNDADGRDLSWLWDVPFDSLRSHGVAMVAGIRAHDMALRLRYDEVPFARVEPDLAAALRGFLADSRGQPKRIYCTYTAMLTLRRELRRVTTVERVG